MLERNPAIKAEEVSRKLGTAKAYTYVLMSKARAAHSLPTVAELKKQVAERAEALGVTIIETIDKTADPVNNPAHYTTGGIETIDFIEAKKLGYNLGNVVKYITRAEHKGNKLEDLRKAQWYLSREILANK